MFNFDKDTTIYSNNKKKLGFYFWGVSRLLRFSIYLKTS